MSKWRLGLFIVGFGLLPLWISIAWLLVESRNYSNSAEFWHVAPWLVFGGAMFCQYTLAIAGAAIAVFYVAKGTPERKWRFAGTTFVALVLSAAAWLGYGFFSRSARDADQKVEIANVLQFVRDSAVVREVIGDELDVRLSTHVVNGDGEAVKLEVAVSPITKKFRERTDKTQYAIVNVSRTNGHPTYKIRCLTPVHPWHRDGNADPCQP
jgi:hypothetical protein